MIDDEPSVCDVLRAILEANGYRVLSAPDGPAGLALYHEHTGQISVVLTDMMMPAMQGAKVISALRKISPEVRILAVSGHAEPRKFGVTPEPGRLEFLAKPMKTTDLLQTLRRLLA